MCGSPFQRQSRLPSLANPSFSSQSLPGKQAPTLQISQNQSLPSRCKHTSRNQMQKDASNHTPNTLSVTCRRHRLPSLQGCIPVNNSWKAVSQDQSTSGAVLQPQSTSGCSLWDQSLSVGSFATQPREAVLPHHSTGSCRFAKGWFLQRPANPDVDFLSHIVNPRNRGKPRFSAERKIEFPERGKKADFRDPGKSEIPNLALVCSITFSGVFRSAIFRGNQKKHVFLDKMEHFFRTWTSISGLDFRAARSRASHASPAYSCVYQDPHAGCANAHRTHDPGKNYI